ncbi:MAG: hypothetical protein II265_06830, partial [Clostridia bacterium]|nr:hypothetical protein [Clostridia bacterium]
GDRGRWLSPTLFGFPFPGERICIFQVGERTGGQRFGRLHKESVEILESLHLFLGYNTYYNGSGGNTTVVIPPHVY